MKMVSLHVLILHFTLGIIFFIRARVINLLCSFLIVDVESKLLKARMRMQQKYLDQFYMLYDDFNITKLPLLPEEVIYNAKKL